MSSSSASRGPCCCAERRRPRWRCDTSGVAADVALVLGLGGSVTLRCLWEIHVLIYIYILYIYIIYIYYIYYIIYIYYIYIYYIYIYFIYIQLWMFSHLHILIYRVSYLVYYCYGILSEEKTIRNHINPYKSSRW